MDNWTAIIAGLGIIPFSTSTIFLHEMVGHLSDIVINPVEALVYSKKYYQFLKKYFELVGTGQENKLRATGIMLLSNFVSEASSFALKFDGESVPNSLKQMGNVDMLDFATSNIDVQLLEKFENDVLLNPQVFYASIKGHGGDFYDLKNVLRSNNLLTSPVYDFHIETLYINYQTYLREGKNEKMKDARKRLFIAFYNAQYMKMGVNDRAIGFNGYKQAITDMIPSDLDNYTNTSAFSPWSDLTRTSLYFNSFSSDFAAVQRTYLNLQN